MIPTTRKLGGLFGALTFGLALFGTEPSGDCGEYLLMARAFAGHATPEIRLDDVQWVAEHEPRLAGVVAPLVSGIPGELPVLLGSIFRAPSGSYYSYHFWFYSLLAAPLTWVTTLLGAAPVVALGMVNAIAVTLAGTYARRILREGWLGAAVPFLFLLAGTTYYLGWTGPETLTASSLLVSVMAAMSGDLGLSVLASGVAATQNPSALAAAAFAVAGWLVLRWRPELSLFPQAAPRPFDRRSALLLVGGLGLALLPYAFFGEVFGEPSLIQKRATDPALISAARAWSLLFDLNQGMIVGVPGVLLGVALACGLSARRAMWPTLVWTTGITALMGIALTPTLASHNWNSGACVMMRYAYWAAAPALALLIALLTRLPSRRASIVTGFTCAVQLALLAVNGVWGERSSYTQHGWAAKLALGHFPGWYNPIPEIFLERTLGREAPPTPGLVVEWPRKGRPRKILAYSEGPVWSPRLCPGRAVTSRNEVPVSGGARYLNPPLRCAVR